MEIAYAIMIAALWSLSVTREQQIFRSVLAQRGVVIPCFRCAVALTLADTVQKEHLHERALGGPDTWENWRWSHKECHRIITDGPPATAAGSSKNRIAKARRSPEKFRVAPRECGEKRKKSGKIKSRGFKKCPT